MPSGQRSEQTPIRYLEPGQGKAPQGYYWVSNVPGHDTIEGPSLRAAVRASESTPVLARLKRALMRLKPLYLRNA